MRKRLSERPMLHVMRTLRTDGIRMRIRECHELPRWMPWRAQLYDRSSACPVARRDA